MTRYFWSGATSRKIIERVVVEATLVLQTPAHFGNGDGDVAIDMPLLTDTVEPQRPYLQGTSLAGALRGHLLAVTKGYRVAEQKGDSDVSRLFGAMC